jgi:hypothetical protein
MSANMGAARVAADAAELEARALDRDWSQAAAILSRLSEDVAAACQAARAWLTQTQDPATTD